MKDKIFNYYKCYGLLSTIKKTFRYLSIKVRTINGIYCFSMKEKKHIIKKDAKLYIEIDVKMTSKNLKKTMNVIRKLNNCGFFITCYDSENIDDESKRSIEKYAMIKNTKNIKSKTIKISEIYDDSTDLKFLKLHTKKSLFYNNLSIVILNHNNDGIIQKCIDSLIEYNTRYNYEIIVIDNQSSDNSYYNLKKYKNIILKKNRVNGCSSGRNLGASLTSKKYILFLDSDQFVQSNYWLESYEILIEKKIEFGLIGWVGGWFDKKGYAHFTTDDYEMNYMPLNGLCRDDIGYLGTGGMLIEKEIFEKVGGFDENYDPTCYEDTDISLKVRNINKKILYCPYLDLQHKAHQTTKSDSDKNFHKIITKNGNYFVEKWNLINKKLLKERR